jgi:hypothetical protein
VKLAYALLAKYAEIDPNSGLLNVVSGGIDVFGLKHLPASFPAAFALQFRFPESEAGKTFKIEMGVRDPQLQPIGQPTDFEVTPALGEYHADGSHGIYAIAGSVTLLAESVGAHLVWIEIDGAIAGDIPFQVFLAPDG